jgi:hypothetical protein
MPAESRMIRMLLVPALLMLGVPGHAQGVKAPDKPSPSEARPSMPFTGTARMEDDGSLTLHLRLTSDGKEIDDTIFYKTTDRGYDSVLRHLGGMRAGDSKPFRPWRD